MTGTSEATSKARQLAAAGALEQAERVLAEHLARSPGDAGAHHQRGCVNIELERFAHAVEHIRAALALAPGEPAYLSDLALACELSGDSQGAERAYLEAMAAREAFPPAFFNYAAFLRARERFMEAEGPLRRGLALAPRFQPGLRMLGNLLRRRRLWREAREHLTRAAALDPRDAEAHFQLGALEMDTGAFEAAAACFERGLAIEAERTDALLNLGACRQELGDLEGALASYRRALSLDRSLFYAAAKKLVSASRGTYWLRRSELRRALLGD